MFIEYGGPYYEDGKGFLRDSPLACKNMIPCNIVVEEFSSLRGIVEDVLDLGHDVQHLYP